METYSKLYTHVYIKIVGMELPYNGETMSLLDTTS